MTTSSAEFSVDRSNAYRAILWGGLIAGIIDLTYAFVYNYALRGSSPVRISQSIASGLLGADSYKGGLSTAALGVLLHFVIATGAATVYYVASRKIGFLTEQAVICGLIFGVAVYFFMNLVVLPLSAFPHPVSFPATKLVIDLIVHAAGVGLPIALAVRRYSK